MNILITGGAGFIGRHLISILCHKADITVIDSMSTQVHGDYSNYIDFPDNVKFIREDIRGELEQLRGEAFDICYHLAAETGTAQSMFDTKRYFDVNVMGTINLLETLHSISSVDRYVLASSRSVYGEGEYRCKKHGVHRKVIRKNGHLIAGKFVPECIHCGNEMELDGVSNTTSVSPLSQYAATKYTQETILENFCRQAEKKFCIFRFQNVYGAGQSLKNPYTGVLAAFANLSLSNKAISVYEDGQCARDFVHVSDIARVLANWSMLDEYSEKTVDLGSGYAIPLIEIANFVASYFQCSERPNITGQFRVGDIRSNFTNAPISKYLCHEPIDLFENGLPEFLEFARENFDQANIDLLNKASSESVSANILRGS